MRAVVTGADGFVGGWMIRELLRNGHHVTGALRIGSGPPKDLAEGERLRVQWVDFDLLSADSVNALAAVSTDVVIHLAAVASGADARQDPGYAWTVNAAGTARVAEAFGRVRAEGRGDPVLLVVSTGEVYGGAGDLPRDEDAPVVPASPYAASKVGAEVAAAEVSRRTGLRTIIARAFPHTGPGQSDKYVIPALALRLRTAKRIGAPVINVGNLQPIRDILDVRDVVRAYRLLAEGAEAGVYNVASGRGVALEFIVERLMDLVGHRVILETDPMLTRPNDLQHLVGNPAKLRRATGWTPTISLDQTLEDLLDAQAD